MFTLDRDLVRAINKGGCFALVGSGPSCELNLPNWGQLAMRILEKMDERTFDKTKEMDLIAKNKLPEFFGHAENLMGGIGKLLTAIHEALQLEDDSKYGNVYDFIVRWPFSCYLTTNYDDQLYRHMARIGYSFAVRRNSQDDMRLLHSTTSNVIFKIHGDFSSPENIVLTGKQYEEFRKDERRQYWRDNILSCLKMVDIVVIGYRMSDPDFRDQLDRLRAIAAPDNPIFMFVSDVPSIEIKDYYKKRNIRIINYINSSDSQDLRRALSRYDPFIAKRGSIFIGGDRPDLDKAQTATSLYLFNQLRLSTGEANCLLMIYASLLLQILQESGVHQQVKISDMLANLRERSRSSLGIDPKIAHKALEHLYKHGYIELREADNVVKLSANGFNMLNKMKAERDLIKEQFFLMCRNKVKTEYPNLNTSEVEEIVDRLENGIITAFERRGLEIAKFAFLDSQLDLSDATDLLEVINTYSSDLKTNIQKAAFADLMIEVLLQSYNENKRYLSSLCHGYFAYHSLGLDPNCSDERLNMAKEKAWILDSSILLPVLADSCWNHDYAIDLINKMKKIGLRLCTTSNLFYEIKDHLQWAISNFKNPPIDSIDLLLAAEAKAGYRQNLFIDGFVAWAPKQGRPTLDSYLTHCVGKNYLEDLDGAFRNKLRELGIEILGFSSRPYFKETLWADRDDLSKIIEAQRRLRGTFREERQCDTEAEVLIMCQNENAIFLSQSYFLNKLLSIKKNKLVWKPEIMYQFLTLFSLEPAQNNLLYQCMTQEFFYAGFNVVDTKALTSFASPLIRQSRMKLEEEREEHKKLLGQVKTEEFETEFDRTPDIEKPFYSMQFAFYVAERERERRVVAEKHAMESTQSSGLSLRERTELAKLRSEKRERIKRHKKPTKNKKSEKSKGKKRKGR